jgi:4-hydroxy 2-oxovalerate aldolase
MPDILISDPTLRDGNHAVRHSLTLEHIAAYAQAADKAGVPIVEVGHGNGLGASSLQVGEAAVGDIPMLETVRGCLKTSRLGIHCMPGFATIKRDLKPALDIGVDVVRVASHCTEADITQRHIAFVREYGRTAYGTLMMTHMAPKETLLTEARKMQDYGASAVIFMDSAGAYLPSDVRERMTFLVENLDIAVGFHAHNNLGMAIANSLVAAESGVAILDATARGFGAGAGNTQLEVLIPVLEKSGFHTGIDVYKMLDVADLADRELLTVRPEISSLSVVSGIHGVFSGFIKHVERIASQYSLDPRRILAELGRRKAVGGQEDLIVDVATNMKKKGES